MRAAALRKRKRTDNTADITFYNLLVGGIAWVFDVAETASPKPGNGGLKLLKAVSNVIGDKDIVPEGGGAEDKDQDCQYNTHGVLQPAGG